METMQALDAAFLLIVTSHAIIMLERDEDSIWKHSIGRAFLAALGFFSFSIAVSRLSDPVHFTLDYWERFGFDAAVAMFIAARVWLPRYVPTLDNSEIFK